jgi:nitrite reductase/ring-hydroxylating ferredoxin subunit
LTGVRAELASDGIAEGQCVAVEIGGREIAVLRCQGVVHALSNRCTHAGSRLDGGRVGDSWIACPLHGARFDLASGACVNRNRRYAPLRRYRVSERSGMIEIWLPEGEPAGG